MKTVMKPMVVGVLLVGAAGIGVRAYYTNRGTDQPTVATAPVTRGAVRDVVAATGALQAVTTVQVGTQVSGTISWLGADFNSIVRKGQVIAKLDPSLFDTQVEQARANLTKASADVDNAQVKVSDAQQKYGRASELAARQLVAQSDLDAAKVAVDVAEATLRSTRAQVTQAQASLNQAQLNLSNTIITAPINGIVIGRSVDVGQTVAASLSSPTVFSIAADLAEMRVSASIDESDIGRIQPAQPVTFRVDAYPGEEFAGIVSQIRLQPAVVQNVTTYSVMIDAPNTELKLKPGMTANVSIEIAARADVLRVPNAALRFRPTAAMFTALAQTQPDGPPGAGTPARAGSRVWIYADNQLKPVPVALGISDGQTTELLEGSLSADSTVVTNVVTGTATATRTAAAAAASPFTPGGFGGPGGPAGAGGAGARQGGAR